MSAAPDRPLSAAEVTGLIIKAKGGALSHQEQVLAGHALDYYRSAALRAEAAIHVVVKDLESIERRGAP